MLYLSVWFHSTIGELFMTTLVLWYCIFNAGKFVYHYIHQTRKIIYVFFFFSLLFIYSFHCWTIVQLYLFEFCYNLCIIWWNFCPAKSNNMPWVQWTPSFSFALSCLFVRSPAAVRCRSICVGLKYRWRRGKGITGTLEAPLSVSVDFPREISAQ